MTSRVGVLCREPFAVAAVDAAEPHYRSIWDLCSQEEKLVLVQLAQEGLVNPKRTDVMRRLARRGLVRVDPRYALVNDSFALFVSTVESPERVAGWETAAKLQTWRKMSVPLYALAVVVIALVLYTEQSLLTNVIALATGAAGALRSFRNLYAQAKSITGARPAQARLRSLPVKNQFAGQSWRWNGSGAAQSRTTRRNSPQSRRLRLEYACRGFNGWRGGAS